MHRIKPRAPPLVRAPVNSFEFQSCDRTPQAECLSCLLRHTCISTRTPSIHRLPPGLPGYLIPFATLAFAPQRQLSTSKPPSPPMFFPISTHFTATQGIPLTSSTLQSYSFNSLSQLSCKILLLTCKTACAPFTPSNSGQRSPPTYYRGCWHVVSRGLFM